MNNNRKLGMASFYADTLNGSALKWHFRERQFGPCRKDKGGAVEVERLMVHGCLNEIMEEGMK